MRETGGDEATGDGGGIEPRDFTELFEPRLHPNDEVWICLRDRIREPVWEPTFINISVFINPNFVYSGSSNSIFGLDEEMREQNHASSANINGYSANNIGGNGSRSSSTTLTGGKY
ncbi:unnamed protein product [Gongylonema pulchrum]|uniref:UBC core domain-containing protein n=1 Tax=Gongylonema pulchrum TaxID=637853 RepID=A0A183DCF4_9BILA|nr:unnamed protein product [Gongylonema pulchrum]